MKLSRALVATVVSIIAALGLCANADAANFIIGPSLTGAGWISEPCESTLSCTFTNLDLDGSGTNLTSPVGGAIVGFNVLGGSTPGTYQLRALKLAGNRPGFSKTLSAPVAAVPNEGVQRYPVLLPIEAGETISLIVSETASISDLEGVGSSEWIENKPAEHGHGFGLVEPGIFGFNAEIQPGPTISSLGTTSGPTSGGTPVAISGTDLENATGVSFGSSPAVSFTVDSESQITAVAPWSASAAAVSVTVSTIAGKATSAQQFGYVAPPLVVTPRPKLKTPVKQCVVPSLKGKKLTVARAALKNGYCKVWKVMKLKGTTPKSGKVAAQSRKPGTKAAAGTKVNLTLKP